MIFLIHGFLKCCTGTPYAHHKQNISSQIKPPFDIIFNQIRHFRIVSCQLFQPSTMYDAMPAFTDSDSFGFLSASADEV